MKSNALMPDITILFIIIAITGIKTIPEISSIIITAIK
jgi:hypothetical protein